MGPIKGVMATRNLRILGISLIGCLLVFLCAEAVVNWYVRGARQDAQALTKIAGMNDQADAALNPVQPLPKTLPDDLLAALKRSNAFTLRYKVSDIPDSVRTAFAKAAAEQAFSMAEPKGAWEATDVISDPALPRRRLYTVATNGAFCLLFYEHGGIGKSNNVAAFRFSSAGAEPVWHAYLDPGVVDPAGLRVAIERNNVFIGAGFY